MKPNAAVLLSSSITKPSFDQLAAIKGALWTVKGLYPLGPRPGQPDNIFAPDYYEQYDAAVRAQGRRAYRDRRYTHAPHGPIIAAGYHGQFADEDWRADFGRYLDFCEEWQADGLFFIEFLKPDGWTFEQLRALEPLFRQPRCQELFQIVVPGGWEPWMLNAEWVQTVRWAADVFPQAVRLIHMPPDHDAPGLSSESIDGGEMWSRVAPFVHGWLVQNAGFADPNGIAPNGKTNFENFQAQFDPHGGPSSLTWRFQTGYAGWPQSCARGAGKPLLVYAGEYASEWVYNDNRPESEAQAWGDAAMRQGGCSGYCDGGTVNVPEPA